ncbi:MAG: hypothetical protein E7645_02050 [Ruminococcaceae bacterium]|nr:hypothetical protein [Oscillospiraceae bacterium]
MKKHLVILSAACGVGKTTIQNTLRQLNLLPHFACLDSDEMGINWWDYTGTPREADYTKDCLATALARAGDRSLVFCSCIAPPDFCKMRPCFPEISSVQHIGMFCSDDEVRRRLLARPAERMCGDEKFIRSQIEYNQWIREHPSEYAFHIDNTPYTEEETARIIADFILG